MLQVASNRAQRADRREAAVGVVAVDLEVFRNECVEKDVAAGVELAEIDKDHAEWPRLFVGPGVEGGKQRSAIDEVVLEGQDAEQQIAGSVGIRRPRVRWDR